jgi:outer membrane autotransporter protein
MPITLNKSYAADIAIGTADTDGEITTLNFTADVAFTSTPAAASAYTLAVTTATTNTGTLSILGTTGAAPFVSTFNSTVGETGKLLKLINVGVGTAGGSAVFDGNVFATNMTVIAGDVAPGAAGEPGAVTFKANVTTPIALTHGVGLNTLTFGATTAGSDQTITGAITTGTTGTGTIIVNNTTGKKATFASNIGVAAANKVLQLTVNAAKTAEFQGVIGALNATFSTGSTTTILNDGHAIGTGNAGALTFGGTGTVINIGRGVVAGETVFDTTNSLAADGGVVITATTINLPSNFSTGAIKLIDDNTIVVTDDELALLTLTNTPLTSFVATKTNTNTDVEITATAKSDATTASELGVNTNKAAGLRAAVLAAATQGTDTTLIDALTTVLNAGTTTDTAMANQVAPQTDTIAGSTVAAKAVTSGVQNIMSNRLASLRSGDAYSTGVVTGSGMSANSGFIQAFGSTVEQKNKGNEFGYDADTTGFALGFDGKISDGVVLGISYANSKTDVDGKGTGKAKNDIKTNSGSIYADYTTKDGYVEGSITYGKSDNKGSRLIDTEGLARTYASNYDSEQYSFRLSGGLPQSLGGGAFFTPFAGATISQIKTDAYTETSTTADDALRLRVAQDTVDSQVGTIGIKYHQVIKDGKTTFTPEVKLAVNQEFGDDTITSTNTYQGGGASFKNSTAIEKTSATAGVGLNISSDNVSFNIGYEADVRDKYLGHSAQAKITAKF